MCDETSNCSFTFDTQLCNLLDNPEAAESPASTNLFDDDDDDLFSDIVESGVLNTPEVQLIRRQSGKDDTPNKHNSSVDARGKRRTLGPRPHTDNKISSFIQAVKTTPHRLKDKSPRRYQNPVKTPPPVHHVKTPGSKALDLTNNAVRSSLPAKDIPQIPNPVLPSVASPTPHVPNKQPSEPVTAAPPAPPPSRTPAPPPAAPPAPPPALPPAPPPAQTPAAPPAEAEPSREMCDMSLWGLPREVLSRYIDLGITHMFPWQAQCLSMEGVLRGGNLVYCAPTSAGKTLVAELLLIKRVLETKQKVLFILPFVSVASEKTVYLQGLLEETDIVVGGFFGSRSPPGGLAKVHVAVCTIEKGNNIVNRLLEAGEIDQLGCVVVDEVHMVGDPHRGYLLELLLTKVLYSSKGREAGAVQIIGMSATLPNLSLLSSWLSAALYTTDYRPVPLTQYVKIGCKLYNTQGKEVRALPSHPQEHIIYLCQETLGGGHNVLIFCATKIWCEKLALLIAQSIICDKQALDETLQLDTVALEELCEQLKRLPISLDPTLSVTIRSGVAFHHAGLTVDEREIVERGFRRGVIRVLLATSTLSAGVNLPARRVIIRSPKFAGQYMSPLVYQQMSGRAGRKGVDEAGESILICSAQEKGGIDSIVAGGVRPVSSCLQGGAMKRAIMEVIASGVVQSYADILSYTSCTLLSTEQQQALTAHVESAPQDLPNLELLTDALTFLEQNEFIMCTQGEEGKVYTATKLGRGTLNSSLPPHEALELLDHLQMARQNFNLESELQLIYEVTPLQIAHSWPSVDWYKFLCLWEKLSPRLKRAGDSIGVNEGFLARALSGRIPLRTPEQRLAHNKHLRFFAALALYDVVEEVPLDTVALKYGTHRGMLQALQSSAASYAGQVTVFCERLNFSSLSLLLADLQTRLFSGVQRELCDLVRCSLLSGPLARELYNAGYTGVAALSSAEPAEIQSTLAGVLPFNTRHGGDRGRSWLDKRHGLTEREAVQHIIDSAREILNDDLSKMNIQMNLSDILNKGRPKDNNRSNQGKPKENTSNPKNKHKNISSKSVSSSSRTPSNISKSSSKTPPPNLLYSRNTSKTFLTKPDLSKTRPVASPGVVSPAGSSILNVTQGSRVKISPNIIPAQKINNKTFAMPPKAPTTFVEPTGRAHRRSKPFILETEPVVPIPPISPPPPDTLSSSFDEFNVSAWDFLDVDEDLLALKDEPVLDIKSPKRKPLNSPDKSPVKRVKLNSPRKSPLLFKDNCTGARLAGVTRNLNTTFDNVISEKKIAPEASVANKVGAAVVQSVHRSVSAKSAGSVVARPLSEAGPSVEYSASEIEGIYRQADKLLDLDDDTDSVESHYSLMKGPGSLGLLPSTPSLTNSTPPSFANCSLAESPMKQTHSTVEQGHTVIDVTGNDEVFHLFLNDWRSKSSYAIALAWDNQTMNEVHSVNQSLSFAESVSSHYNELEQTSVVGIAVCWGEMDSYYVNLRTEQDTQSDLSIATPALHSGLSYEMRIQCLRDIFHSDKAEAVIGWDMKSQWKLLTNAHSISIGEKVLDCKVAAWLLDPDAKEPSFISLVSQHIPEIAVSCGIAAQPLPGTPRLRSCLDAVLAWHLHCALQGHIQDRGDKIARSYIEVESPIVRTLARMELNGFGFSREACETQQKLIVEHMAQLEQVAYTLAHSSFSLSSPAEISEILYTRLHLPPNGDPSKPIVRKRGKRPVYSTSKDVLLKLAKLHPLPGVIIEWRRVSSALSKTLIPMKQSLVECAALNMPRLHPLSQSHTSTGRVSFHEPNIQNINKEFELDFPDQLKKGDTTFVPSSANLRSMFVPYPGAVLVAADYSQLELRLIAQLSKDKNLRSQLNSGGDVFKGIAAGWKGCDVQQVSVEQRQQAKQICYGILYGMGEKSLAAQLGVSENDAGMFMETFMDQYPSLKQYIRKTVRECKDNGYVETILGRRRYLPAIHSELSFARQQAERQCVNTTIQGSAADLVKVAMINIDRCFQDNYPDCESCHSHLMVPRTPRGAFLVLQMHDELIFEVHKDLLHKVCALIKYEMEKALKLKVKLPVNIKVGDSWGTLQDYIPPDSTDD